VVISQDRNFVHGSDANKGVYDLRPKEGLPVAEWNGMLYIEKILLEDKLGYHLEHIMGLICQQGFQ